MIKVLFVCMGNICRSPTAEAIFNKMLKDNNLEEHFLVDSAGTHGYHVGHNPDKRSQACALNRGIDMAHLVSRQVELTDFHEFDYIIAMDQANYDNLVSLSPEQKKHKVSRLLAYHRQSDLTCVPDPYYGAKGGFDEVFDLIETSLEGFLQHLKDEHNI